MEAQHLEVAVRASQAVARAAHARQKKEEETETRRNTMKHSSSCRLCERDQVGHRWCRVVGVGGIIDSRVFFSCSGRSLPADDLDE